MSTNNWTVHLDKAAGRVRLSIDPFEAQLVAAALRDAAKAWKASGNFVTSGNANLVALTADEMFAAVKESRR